MTFSWALERLKAGASLFRLGWNGRHTITLYAVEPVDICTVPYIVITMESGEVRPWLASQADLLMDDWAESSSE